MDFPINVAVPAGTTCSGTMAGQQNVCFMKIANSNNAGPFGGVIAFQMAGAGGAAAGNGTAAAAAPAAAAPATAAPATAADAGTAGTAGTASTKGTKADKAAAKAAKGATAKRFVA
jgi:hypothetical protein